MADEIENATDPESICREARERVQYSEDIDSENRRNAREDTEFVWVRGKQWPDGIRQEREAADRPWLEINQLPQFVNTVVNDQRQGRPGIRIHPASGDASEEVAEILQGMMRHIEYDSNAEAAYDSAFAHAVTGGRGYWRVCSEYEDGETFNQKLIIKRVPDPLSVRLDPDYQDPDGGDAKWCFVTEAVTRSEFEKRWPKAEAVSWDVGSRAGNLDHWYEGADKIIVADYYRVVEEKRILVVMTDGTVGWKDDLPKVLPPVIEIAREREADDCRVEWYKIAGGEQILETYEWPGKFIPVVMCVGDEIMVDGKRIFQGLIRRARDPQTMYNFWQTAATELIALAPKAPFVAAEGQTEDYANDWQAANRKNLSVLIYKPTSIGGQALPPPERQQFAGVPTGIVEQANQCKQDLRATIGIYDPSLGRPSNETSGRAILARERQGDVATFHFVDNLARAISLTGRILLDLIPHYYDTERIVTVIDEEENREMVTVNQRMVSPVDLVSVIVNPKTDLSMGQFAVTVDSGPNYQTKRLEAADSMMQFIQSYPPAAQVAGDLIAKAMDWPGAEQIAARLKLMLPPPIQQAEAAEEKGQAPLPPQVAQQMAAMQQQIQQAQQALQQLGSENQQLKSGVVEKVQIAQMENERKMRDSEMDNQRKARDVETELQLKTQQALLSLRADEEIALLKAQSAERIAKLQSDTDLAIAALKAPPPPAPDPAMMDQSLPQVLLAIAGQIKNATALSLAPRHSKLMLDESGNPVGSISQSAPEAMPEEQAPQGPVSLGDALMSLGDEMRRMIEASLMPRHTSFVFDASGNPVGSTSRAKDARSIN